MYLTLTRPDICYAIHRLSQFLSEPREPHMLVAQRILQQIKSTPGQGIYFPANSDFRLKAFCDDDWVGCPNTRKSLTDYCVFLGNSLISWRSKKQTIVSIFFAEVEYCSIATTCCEITWLFQLLEYFKTQHHKAALLYCDNKAALHIAANPVFHERTKNIKVDCHLIRKKKNSSWIDKDIPHSKQLSISRYFHKGPWPSSFHEFVKKIRCVECFQCFYHISRTFPRLTSNSYIRSSHVVLEDYLSTCWSHRFHNILKQLIDTCLNVIRRLAFLLVSQDL